MNDMILFIAVPIIILGALVFFATLLYKKFYSSSLKTSKSKKGKNKNNYPLKNSRRICLSIILCLLGITILLADKEEWELTMVVIATIGGFIYKTLGELKAPHYANVFCKGKIIGEIGPGWHWTFAPLYKLEPVTKAQQHILLPQIEMYKKDGTPIKITKGRLSYRIKNTQKTILLKDAEGKMLDVTLAKLKGAIGRREFTGEDGLVAEQGSVEDEIHERLKKEMKRYGYEIQDVELSDYDEVVHSKAAETTVIGNAEAAVQGKKAQAISAPLKDNYPAAIASAATSIATAVAKILAKKK